MNTRALTSVVLAMAFSLATGARADESPFPWLTERKILGTNDLEPVGLAAGTAAHTFARAIAHVEMVDDSYGYCTGSRVGEHLFLTNYHCDVGCDIMQFRLGDEKDVPEMEQPVFRCKTLLHRNEALDFALYATEPASGPGAACSANYPILKLWDGEIHVDQALVVASHPKSRQKELDRSTDCKLATITPFVTESGRTTIKHMCDTEGGSSGAPVLDRETGAAVALHWGGKDNEYNMAIPMTLILDELRAHAPAGTIEQLTIGK